MQHLLPIPAPLPRRAAWGALALLLSAVILLSGAPVGAMPGDPSKPFAAVTSNLHWQVHARGLTSYLADDLHGFPLRTDRVVTDGVPLDALTSWPFCAVLGHEPGMWAWTLAVLWAAGLAAAWLGARWWGTLGGALVAGVGFQAGEALLREVSEGRPTQAFAAIFLPLALGWGVDAARSGRAWPAVGAGLAAGVGTLASWSLGPILGLAAFGPSGAVLFGTFFWGRGARPPATPPGSAQARAAAHGAAPDVIRPEQPVTSGNARTNLHLPTDGAAERAAGETRGAATEAGPAKRGATVDAGATKRSASGVRGSRFASLSVGFTLLAAFATVTAPVIAWVLSGRGELPSFGMNPWDEAVLGMRQVRPVDLAAARIHGLTGVALGTLRPALLAAAVWGAVRAPARRQVGPLAFAGACAVLGLGAWLPGPVVLPWGWLQLVPGLERLWWADRAWIGVALGLALLAGAAPPRARGVLGPVLLVEAWLLSSALPMGALPRGPSDAARVLAQAPDVPLVLVPTGEGPFRPDRLDLVDQVHHGRPLANGTRGVIELLASDATLRGWRDNDGLRALLACELGGGSAVSDAERAGATEALVRAGLREVYLDPRYGADPAYAACVEGVLAGWERREEPPLVRYRAR